MTTYVVPLSIAIAALVTAIVVVLKRYGFPRFEVRIQDPEPEEEIVEVAPIPVPVSDISPPAWLTELRTLGFRTFESNDDSLFGATAPQGEFTICIGLPHPYLVCSTCNVKAIRQLGETPLFTETTANGDRISWVGHACGRCGAVDLTTNPNAARFLSLMLFDSRSMLTMVAQAKQHQGKPLNEIITAMMMQNEGLLQARVNRLSALRTALPTEKLAKVLPFQKGKRPKKRRRDRF